MLEPDVPSPGLRTNFTVTLTWEKCSHFWHKLGTKANVICLH